MTGQQAHVLQRRISTTVRLNYWLYLPDTYGDSVASWPLVIFLHGMGERGDNLELVKKHGLPRLAERNPAWPFVVVSPQCPANSTWNDQIGALDALYRDITQRYAIDLERVYLTGLSMGGYGTWHWATLRPRRFAGIVPICGGAFGPHGYPERVAVLKNVPVWAFHGAKDEVVPLAASQGLVDVLQGVGGNARLTVYPDAGHDSWTATYDDPELYTWLLAQRRHS
jgi:predicted peptidase